MLRNIEIAIFQLLLKTFTKVIAECILDFHPRVNVVLHVDCDFYAILIVNPIEKKFKEKGDLNLNLLEEGRNLKAFND